MIALVATSNTMWNKSFLFESWQSILVVYSQRKSFHLLPASMRYIMAAFDQGEDISFYS
jgi:hypothetical protein